MLKPKVLCDILAQANTGGVENTFIVSKDGLLLAFSGYGDRDARGTAAIASNIWGKYWKSGKSILREDEPQIILMELEAGRIAIIPLVNVLLCLYANDSVGFGMLKHKANALAVYLEEPLKYIVTS